MDSSRPGTVSKEMENETAMSSVRRCAFIRIESLEFIQHFESTSEIVVTMSMENRRSKKLISQRFSANNGEPCTIEINGEFRLFYSHNVKNHRDPILRFAVENTRAKTFTRHRSIAASLVSMQQVVQHDFDGSLTLYESHVTEKNPIGRLRVQIRSIYVDDDESSGDSEDNYPGDVEDNDSSEGENHSGLSRISRSIRNIFASSSGTSAPHSQRHQSTDFFPPDRAGSPRADLPGESLLPASSSHLRDLPVNHSFRNKGQISDVTPLSSIGGHSYDNESILNPTESQVSDIDCSSSFESGNGEIVYSSNQSIQYQLHQYEENSSDEYWIPFVLLLQKSYQNQQFYQYLIDYNSEYHIPWKNHVLILSSNEILLSIQQLYSIYSDKTTEHDLEPFRILYIGDDSFTWYLLLAYLLLFNQRPNELIHLSFLPLSLSCSLTQYIAYQNLYYLQNILEFGQLLSSSSFSAVIIQILETLVKADYSTQALTIHEVALQRRCVENEDLFGNPEIAQFLSNDQGKGNKLKIPYLFSVSLAATMPFSSFQYIQLLLLVEKTDMSKILPNLLSLIHYNIREENLEGTIDYWISASEQKQVTLESKGLLKSLSVQRFGNEGDLNLVVTIPLDLLNNKKKKMLVNKDCLVDKGKTKEGIEQYECVINKLMVSFQKEETVYIDGMSIENVEFMTVSNRYFSRNKTFPICIPFVESND